MVGDEFVLTATVSPTDAANKDVTWTSDKAYIATVDNNGKVKGVKEGEATITVTTKDDNKTTRCKVTVVDAEAEKAALFVTYPYVIKINHSGRSFCRMAR